MGSYSQWNPSRKLSRVIWLYGPEKALVREIRQYVKSLIAPSELDFFSFDATCDYESCIWDTLYSRSLTDGVPRLVEVLNADRLKDIDRLEDWIVSYSKHSPETTLIMVAEEEPSSTKVRAPRATVIKCVMPKLTDRVQWVMSQGNLSEPSAMRLLSHKNGDLLGSLDICQKIKTLLPELENVELSEDTIRTLDDETPCDFSSSLLEKDKSLAFNAIEAAASEGAAKVLSYLDYSLGLVDRLRDVLETTPRGQKLETIPGFPMGRLSELLPIARSYSLTDIVRCKQLIAVLESYLRHGIQEGILESLTSMW